MLRQPVCYNFFVISLFLVTVLLALGYCGESLLKSIFKNVQAVSESVLVRFELGPVSSDKHELSHGVYAIEESTFP